MKTRESEIFNEYVKLAIESGVVPKEELNKKADYTDKTRYDSNSFSDIEALYGHKFKPNDGEDESIVDVAHPDTMVVGPAYDAMNAVVENLHQRQDILSHIALKTPDGHLVQRRYVAAMQDLVQSLVSTGFKMDNESQEDLMKLADSCAGRLSNESIEKKAYWGLAFTAAAAIAPYIYDYVVKSQAEREAKLTGGSKKQVAKNSRKNRAVVNRRIKGGFKRLGLGLVLLGAYNVLKDQLIGNIDRGIDKNAQNLEEALIDLSALVQPVHRGHIQSYLAEVRDIREANMQFSQRISNYNVDATDFYAVEGAKESRKFIDEFYNKKLAFERASNEFYSRLEGMQMIQPDTITDSDEELFIRQVWDKLTGAKQEVANAIETLVDSLNKYMSSIGSAVTASKKSVEQVEEQTAQQGEEGYVNYVEQLVGEDEAEPQS